MKLTSSNNPRLPGNYLTMAKVYVIDSFTQLLLDVSTKYGVLYDYDNVHITHRLALLMAFLIDFKIQYTLIVLVGWKERKIALKISIFHTVYNYIAKIYV